MTFQQDLLDDKSLRFKESLHHHTHLAKTLKEIRTFKGPEGANKGQEILFNKRSIILLLRIELVGEGKYLLGKFVGGMF